MKRFTLFVAYLLAVVLSVQASSYTDDNSFTWYYITNDDGTNTITLTNSNEAETTISSAWTTASELTVPKSFTIDDTEYTITQIGKYCFRSCSSLESIDLSKCTELTSLGNYCFYQCTSLASATLPSSVATMGNYCFYGCTSLASIILFSSITSLGTQCFYGCSALTSVDFSNCSNLTSVGVSAFASCTSLESADLSGCTSLTILGTSLGGACFSGCTALESVTLPSGITSVGNQCFYNCTSLETIDLSSYTSLTSLSTSCFQGCTGLKSITLPSAITSLGQSSFYGCTSLESIDLSSYTSLTSLGGYCFRGCTGLESITLPSSVTSLGTGCFWGCTSLTTMICYATSIPTASSYAFGNSSNYMGGETGVTKLYVLPYSLETWSAVTSTSNWSTVFTSTSQLYPFADLTISSAGMATLALPFEATIPNGVECYTLGTTASEPAEGVAYVSATEVESTLGQGTPVLVKGDEGKYHFLGTTPYSEDSDDSPVVAEQTASVPQDGNGLVGTYEATTIYQTTTDDDNTYYNYVLQNQSGNVRFYQVGASGKSVGQFRAWLQLEEDLLSSDSGTTPSIAFVFNSSDEMTGISEAATTTTATTGIYYDLQGRAVKSPQKGGIYIHDGRKVIL